MPMDKSSILNLLKFLEEKYPSTFSTMEELKKNAPSSVNPEELFRLLYFCWEEKFIGCTTEVDNKAVAGFNNIRITSTGIRFLRGI
jgi:hypothetical protein